MEPYGVGTPLASRHISTAGMGEKPSAASMPAGMATAVPKPAMPSIKPPKHHATNSAKILRSLEIEVIIWLITPIAPVLTHRLYVNTAAMITSTIGHSAIEKTLKACGGRLVNRHMPVRHGEQKRRHKRADSGLPRGPLEHQEHDNEPQNGHKGQNKRDKIHTESPTLSGDAANSQLVAPAPYKTCKRIAHSARTWAEYHLLLPNSIAARHISGETIMISQTS